MLNLGEVLGYFVVLGIIGLLIYELIRQIKDFKLTKKDKSTTNKNRIMIFSLLGIILFYSLNILVSLGIIVSEYVTSGSTSIGIIISFAVHIIAKFRNKNERGKSNFSNSLLK